MAARQDAHGSLILLLASGADPAAAAERSLKTALHAACEHGRTGAVATLLAARASALAVLLHPGLPAQEG